MKKRVLSLLLVLMMIVSLVPAMALAEDDIVAYAVTGGNIYFNKSTGEITDCDSEVTEANIPSEIDGVKVTSIGDSAFYDCKNLKNITIPDSVTSIGNCAFSDCPNLTDIYYTGSAEQWNAMSIEYEYNEALLNVKIHYNYHEHVTEIINAKAATCTEAGYSGDEVCTICGEVISQGETIEATGHHFKGNSCPDCGATRSTADTIRAFFQTSFNNFRSFFDKLFGR